MGSACAICGKPNAPFGLRPAGTLRALPAAWRRYLWHCGASACEAAALARRAVFVGEAPRAPSPAVTPAHRQSPSRQPDLFGG
jgi:hypothetical protein